MDFIKLREKDGRFFIINPHQIVSISIDANNDNWSVINTSDNNTFYVRISFEDILKFLDSHGLKMIQI
jgi:predicted PolB exonuclease-like 3'-5' exonuclease